MLLFFAGLQKIQLVLHLHRLLLAIVKISIQTCWFCILSSSQLSADGADNKTVGGFPTIRWAQTANYGYVPNPRMKVSLIRSYQRHCISCVLLTNWQTQGLWAYVTLAPIDINCGERQTLMESSVVCNFT